MLQVAELPAEQRSRFVPMFIVCALLLIVDGFDAQAIGYVAPLLREQWALSPDQLGPVFAAGLAGMVVGSLLLSLVADRVGRRPVLIFTAFFCAVVTWATGHASSVEQLLVIRFVNGIALGGMMPNILALVSDFSPEKRRSQLLMIMACFYSAGAALGGVLAAWLLPIVGWPAIFHGTAVLAGLIGIAAWRVLPESPHFGRSALQQQATTTSDDGPQDRGVAALLRKPRTIPTLLLWLMHFMNLAVLYLLSSWLPLVAKDSGLPLREAVLAGAALQAGSVLGAFGLGALISRHGFYRVLVPSYVVGGLAIATLAFAMQSPAAAVLVAFIAGFCALGGLNGINALAASSYPSSLRSTGVGWALGIGRLGSILAPVLGGTLLAMQWAPRSLLILAAAPCVVLALSLLLLSSATASGSKQKREVQE